MVFFNLMLLCIICNFMKTFWQKSGSIMTVSGEIQKFETLINNQKITNHSIQSINTHQSIIPIHSLQQLKSSSSKVMDKVIKVKLSRFQESRIELIPWLLLFGLMSTTNHFPNISIPSGFPPSYSHHI